MAKADSLGNGRLTSWERKAYVTSSTLGTLKVCIADALLDAPS